MMQNRFQVINVWRPLIRSQFHHEYTFDYLRLSFIRCRQRYSCDRAAKTNNYRSSYRISRNAQDAQKWYYLNEMRSDEMFVFKIFDSNPDVARFGAHTSFINEHAPPTDLPQKKH